LMQLNDIAGASALLEPLMDGLMMPSLHADHVTMFQLAALIGGGTVAERTGSADRAQQLWRRGLQLAVEGLTTDPESATLRLYAAAFRGYTAATEFADEARRVMTDIKREGLNPFALVYLAIAYAHRGETANAIDVFRYVLTTGRLAGRGWMTVWTPALTNAPGFKQLTNEYLELEERRRRRYGDAS
jgi:hypothetical protein